MKEKIIKFFKSKIFIGFIVIVVAIQLVPYGRNHTNPKVIAEPKWDSPQTRELFFRACKDCHSNETTWPWYSNIAPMSWLVQDDVDEGRSKFNVSEWGRKGKNEGDEAAEHVREGEMPPMVYLPLHPEAKFTEKEKQDFLKGLISTFGDEEKEGGKKEDHDDDD